jgi:hypothetical protein
MRPDHRQLETATSGGLSDYPVTPSKEPGSVDEAVIGLSPSAAMQCGYRTKGR